MNNNENTTAPDPERQELLRKLRTVPELYVLFSLCTRAPYVVCDEETFDDEIFLFLDAEAAKKEVARLAAEKTPVSVAKLENKNNQLLLFYTSLYTMGVNAMMVQDGGKVSRVQLEEFVKRGNIGKQSDGKVWIENPALHLTALYYMQESRKNPEREAELGDLKAEIANGFAKGSYIVAVQKEGNGVPLVKLKNDELFQPLFTDVLEFQKFNREDKLKPLIVAADKVPQILAKEAKGIVVNPMEINMTLTVTRQQAQ